MYVALGIPKHGEKTILLCKDTNLNPYKHFKGLQTRRELMDITSNLHVKRVRRSW